MEPRLCIVCGNEFQSDELGAALCPACRGDGMIEQVQREQAPRAGDRTEPESGWQGIEGEGRVILPPDENLDRAGYQSGSSRAPGSDWQIGDVILDTYEVRQVFTSGGMGLVYRVLSSAWKISWVLS